jgi:DNA invertase Pin-like site-specific DNA recombinase
MLVGYMRVSTDSDRQVLDLQRDALLSAGVDERHLFEDRASGSRGDRAGLGKQGSRMSSPELRHIAMHQLERCHPRPVANLFISQSALLSPG